MIITSLGKEFVDLIAILFVMDKLHLYRLAKKIRAQQKLEASCENQLAIEIYNKEYDILLFLIIILLFLKTIYLCMHTHIFSREPVIKQ